MNVFTAFLWPQVCVNSLNSFKVIIVSPVDSLFEFCQPGINSQISVNLLLLVSAMTFVAKVALLL